MKKAIWIMVIMTAFCQAYAQSPEKPNWPLKVIGWDLDKAYPGALYDSRLAVTGGTYPYYFQLFEGPSGMTIDANTGAIQWTAPSVPSTGNQVQVQITDSENRTLTHFYSIEVTKAGFYFVAPNGSDANDGSFENPWLTIPFANSESRRGDILYFRGGTHPIGKSSMNISSGAHVWMSWPGEHVVIDGGVMAASANNIIMCWVSDSSPESKYLFQGLEIVNPGAKAFCSAGFNGAVFRKINAHGFKSTGGNNPGFFMSIDAGAMRPVNGQFRHNRAILQECEIHDLQNDAGHGAGIVCYNVSNLLFEDNEVYDIDGNGINDKDDGYMNTIRNNVLHDVKVGIYLLNQYTQASVDVSHNLVYNASSDQGIIVGGQPGYIKDIYVHHNTLVDAQLRLRWVIAEPASDNINVYNNLIIGSSTWPYHCDNGNALAALVGAKGKFDNNLLWNKSAKAPAIAGSAYDPYTGGPYTLAQWQGLGNDLNSVVANPGLNASHELPANSPYFGVYGRDKVERVAPSITFSVARNPRLTPSRQSSVSSYDIRGRLLPGSVARIPGVHFTISHDISAKAMLTR